MIFPFSPDACPDRQHMSFSSNRNPAAGRKFNGPYRYAVLRENRQRKQYLSAGIDPEPVILRGTLIGLTKNFTEIADSIEPAHLCDFAATSRRNLRMYPAGAHPNVFLKCLRNELSDMEVRCVRSERLIFAA